MLIRQAERLVQLYTPLGDDVLYLDRFRGCEEISRLYRFELGMYSEDREITFDDIVGQPVAVAVARVGAGPRFFHGHVSEFEHVVDVGEYAYYRAVVVPWLWFLTRTSNCRIFQGMTPQDIVREVIRSHGFSNLEIALEGTYPELEYCTQYRETDFNFVSRILEEFGMHYTFRHEAERHVLRIVDSVNAHETVTGLEEIPFDLATEDNRTNNTIWEWTVGRRVQPFRYELRDFDYTSPAQPLVSMEMAEPRSHEHSEYEIYDYTGLRMTSDDENLVATRRIEEMESRYERAHAWMGSAGLGAGDLFSLTGAPRADQDREYFVLGGEHEILTNRFRSGGVDTSSEENYQYRFSCQPTERAFRPARVTPRPVIQGPQTAIVTGPDGEEIHVDSQARVKVRFHWDRSDTPNEDSSIWIRVAQMWAGSRMGTLFFPRIGHEVVVEFLEGDPDRPIITGSVFNGTNLALWLHNLDDHPILKTSSGICTQSSKDAEGANMLFFVDKAGEERLDMRAQKDFYLDVLEQRQEMVGKDRHMVVGGNQKDRIEKSRHEVVKGDHSESVGGDRGVKVTGKEAKKVDASQSVTTGGDQLVSVGGDHKETCSGNIELSATGEVKIEATSKITLTCGGSTVEIGPGGVKIQSPKLEYSGLNFDCQAAAGAKITAPTIDLTAAMVTAPGMVQAAVFQANASIISPSYTPGAGNML